MKILFFQIFIALTIFAVKAMAGRHLFKVCLYWTGFTLLAVFTSRLMLIQLATIWLCYSIAKPDGPGTAAGSSARS